MTRFPGDTYNTTASATTFPLYANTTTNWSYRMTPKIITEPAFITIRTGGLEIRGRFYRYVDPSDMGDGPGMMTSAWWAEDVEGVRTWIPWSRIESLVCFPLTHPDAQATAGTETETKPE